MYIIIFNGLPSELKDINIRRIEFKADLRIYFSADIINS